MPDQDTFRADGKMMMELARAIATADTPFRCCRAGDVAMGDVPVCHVPPHPMDREPFDWANHNHLQPPVLPCKLAEGATLPSRGRQGDAGLDLHCRESFSLNPGCVVTVWTGISLAIPRGHFGHILGRSGLARNGVAVLGGVVDHEYRGEIGVVLANVGTSELWFKANDRIAQMVLIPFATLTPLAIDTLDATDRGADGWGSSGR